MSYSVLGPLVGVLTLAAIVGGTLYLLAAYDRIAGRDRGEGKGEGEDDDAPPDG